MSINLHVAMRHGIALSRSGSKFWAQAIIECPDGNYANLKRGRCIEVRAWGKTGTRGQWQVFGGLNTVHDVSAANAILRSKENKGYTFDSTLYASCTSVEDAVARIRTALGDAAGDGAAEGLWLVAESENKKAAALAAHAEASRNAVDEALMSLPDDLLLSFN
jgi:predicted DNA-binding WGR domain protein